MRTLICILAVLQLPYAAISQKKKGTADSYFPPANHWAHRWIKESSFDSLKLSEAIQFAREKESKQPRNQEVMQAMTFGKEPFGEGIGPFAERGDPTGLIIHKGYIIAQWGDPTRVDMTHSVTKSFLSTVVGLAVDKGLIKQVTDTVARYMPPIEVFNPSTSRPAEEFGTPQMLYPFATPHNRLITWDDLLRQTSDWEGTLWGKPDWADRPDVSAANWLNRKRNTPGAVYEYNDVRVNALALAATTVWRKPLPQVLKENIMDKIGASHTWRWTGYRNAWIVLDGQQVQSVSGGGHWGGGMFINAYDMARFGLLTLHRGAWNGQQLLSESWLSKATTPTASQPTYGYMNYFLNTDKKYLPSAPATAYAHIGNGTNMIYVDREHDLVIVARWIENNALDGLVKRVLDALK
jgi:CubicO group peptidase (beta-lactamase class C family)